jgi:uncharacterized protein YjbI with pentapeptide repeats
MKQLKQLAILITLIAVFSRLVLTFTGAIFHNCRFVNCTFQECDLSLLQVPVSTLSNTRFEDSQVIGVDWTKADWTTPRLGNPIGFAKCSINHSTYIQHNSRAECSEESQVLTA